MTNTLATWRDALPERQRQAVAFAERYTAEFGHGATGHNDLVLIAKLAELLDVAAGLKEPPLEQLIAMAQAAGSAGLWLLRAASAVALEWSFVPDSTDLEHATLLEPPHELVMLIRFTGGDGGEAGVEFRQ